ncbi:MAG: hypothetical protein EOO71_28050 [Myxococcaceae bacterium]|nr:MAG: hypothetical protein EOO71_28050 [Myxococcaceae bacterium]
MTKTVAVLVGAVVSLGVLIPAVAWATGWEEGPCDVTAFCPDGSTIACHGEISCSYRSGSVAFVDCDGYRLTCQ